MAFGPNAFHFQRPVPSGSGSVRSVSGRTTRPTLPSYSNHTYGNLVNCRTYEPLGHSNEDAQRRAFHPLPNPATAGSMVYHSEDTYYYNIDVMGQPTIDESPNTPTPPYSPPPPFQQSGVANSAASSFWPSGPTNTENPDPSLYRKLQGLFPGIDGCSILPYDQWWVYEGYFPRTVSKLQLVGQLPETRPIPVYYLHVTFYDGTTLGIYMGIPQPHSDQPSNRGTLELRQSLWTHDTDMASLYDVSQFRKLPHMTLWELLHRISVHDLSYVDYPSSGISAEAVEQNTLQWVKKIEKILRWKYESQRIPQCHSLH